MLLSGEEKTCHDLAEVNLARMTAVLLLVALTFATDCAPAPTGGRGRGAGPGRGGRGGSLTAARIERRSYHFAPTNQRMDYAVYVSPRVNADTVSPLVIVLHGLNNTPWAFLPQVADAVPNTTYILAAPMGFHPQGWYGANGANGVGQGRQRGTPDNLGELSELDVMNVLQIMRRDFRIDSNRIYIFGNSMGGAGAIHLGLKHRDVWAAVGARAPAIRTWLHTPAELEKAGNLPMILVHGDADRLVRVDISRSWAAKMKELNMTYEYHELRNVGHGVDREGVRLVFAFFDKHSRATRR
jgi:predicted esterase